jgi:hypothetical protein
MFGLFLMQPMEIFVDDDTKLTLHGLQQYFIRLQENEKASSDVDMARCDLYTAQLVIAIAVVPPATIPM